MPKNRPQLAKLSRPRLHKPVARERLFRLLDDKREHPVVWIVGPPGAGKTTLAASYLEEAAVPAIWYQIDSGDSDPAAFFYYLKQAVELGSPGRAAPLPALGSEYRSDLSAFARQFLRDALARLPDGVVLVLDNYQELAALSGLHAAFRTAFAEIPQEANVLVISRADPPGALAQLLVNRVIALVDWSDLRLTPEETIVIAAAGGVTDSGTIQDLHVRSGGWVAGLTLMLENLRTSRATQDRHLETPDMLFDYFAGLIFQDAPEKIQEVLMKTAFLPWMNKKLVEVTTGVPEAIVQVEDLHRRHLFTDRRMGVEATYQYHALFRAFLQSKANATMPFVERQFLQRRIAVELFAAGHSEEAFAAFICAADWTGANNVLVESASRLAKQGRWQTLEEWVGALPAELIRTNPWTIYWQGRSATHMDPSAAPRILEVAYQLFLDAEDEIGQLLTATTVLEGIYFSFENLKPMDPWIDRVVSLINRGVTAPTDEDDLRVHSAVMMGATFRSPVHSMLPTCLRRVIELLKEPFEPNLKVSAASMLHGYSNVAMDSEAERVATAIARPLLNSGELSPIRALFYLTAEGYSHYVRGRYAEAFACFDSADAIVKKHAIQDVNLVSATHRRGLCERRAGLLDQAEATALRAESLPLPETGHHRGGLLLLQSVIAFDRGKVRLALDLGVKAYNTYDQAGFFNGLVTVGTVLANMAIVGNRFDMADNILSRLRQEPYGEIAQNYIAAIILNQAWLAHRQGTPDVRDSLLQDALRRANVEGARVRFHWYRNALSELLPVALSGGIECEMAIGLAQEFSVIPNPLDVEQWPWPVRVQTLGQFSLSLHGQAPEYSRKLPRKVLALLKAIIAFGGVDVPEQKLMSVLWPDEDGDAAHRSLTATLHRLRKLLGNTKAIRQAGGELTLDSETCWVDAQAFESHIERSKVDPLQMEKAIDLYRGAFLSRDDDAAWAVPMRERLRTKFIQAVARRAMELESADDHVQAVVMYQRGIDADNLVESFYQGLMRCYERLDRKAEAASTFRRLRQTLSVTLGVQPSAASQRHFDSLRSG